MKKFYVFILVFFGIINISTTQPPTGVGTVDVFGTVVQPVVLLSLNNNLNFGVVMPGLNSGEVMLTPNGVRSTSGAVYLDNGVNVSVPSYRVIGKPNTVFNVNLPSSTIVYNASNEMIVNDIITNLTSNSGTIVPGGTTFEIGATLNVKNFANQPEGIYVGVFEFTVSYD